MRIDLTRSKTYEVAYPYDGNALDTSNILREHYWTHRDIDFLKKHQRKMNSLYMVEGVIGAVEERFLSKRTNTCKRVWKMRISMAGAWRTEKDITVG